MKKINFLLVICLFTGQLLTNNLINGMQEPNEEIYNQEIEKLDKQLEKTVFQRQEKSNLLGRLLHYFDPERPAPRLNTKRTEVLYGSIIQSYHKLLKDPKKIKIANEPLAQKFQEQVLGKILMHKNQLIIRENLDTSTI